jgi:transcriptional regulator with PAS, ATPase and Fis domain
VTKICVENKPWSVYFVRVVRLLAQLLWVLLADALEGVCGSFRPGGLEISSMFENIPKELLLALLDNPYESLILVDSDGIVRFMSHSNEGVYPVEVKSAVGKHIREVSPDSRLTRTLETGKAEIGRSMILKSKNRIIARIPLFHEGRMVGAAGKLMFMSPTKLKELYDRIETLETKIDYFKDELNQVYGGRYSFDSIVGNSELIREAKDLALQAASTDAAVIITGESGTGKELFAHSIHQASRRYKHNFVRVNCAAIPGELIEAELFGYEPGSFTGARRQGKAGKFELAHNGTIFLDEIGDMPMALQVKLMRILQEKEVERLGSGKPKPINFRVISATNRDIKKLIEKKDFRLDLFYRLNVIHIHLPALREIREDIQPIFQNLLRKLSPGGQPRIESVSDEALNAMQNYHWPGNTRELRNVAERATILCKHSRVELKDLPFNSGSSPKLDWNPKEAVTPLKTLMAETERRAILRVLKQTGNNRAEAAKILGIHRTGLYQKMSKYGIS